ncbi:hypothetical protein [Nocardia thailandica]|uniref:hypothetical protein n=1 Tax=Nocardia thailandica TaxID=257275 RepID=UPI0012FBC07D|nr:hypothetical protein [Nocardia thailandica]
MVTVDPATYYAAAKAVHSISNDVAAVAGQNLNPGLFDTAGMAGNYAAVRPWLNAYREYSESFVQTVVSFVSATRTMGDILNMVGYHWDLANFNSNRKGTQGHEPQAPVNGSWSPFDKSSISVPDPEPAPYTTPDSGLTTDPRDMQDALRSAIKAGGTEIPKGNTTKLEIGVAGWRAVATNAAITGAAARIQSVAASFDATDTPDKPTLLEMLETLRKGADGIGAAAAGFASGIQPHQ